MSISPDQCRMARAALGWTVRQLAPLAKLSVNTVVHFEKGRESYRSTADALRAAFEAQGVVFVSAGEVSHGGGAGVRYVPRAPEPDSEPI